MLRLSKKADYALIAMKHLALRGDLGSSSAREIAEQYDIPIELMAKVLQRLVRRGLLISHQGTHGGYKLARRPAQISVADVIQAIEGPVTVTACSTDDGQCEQFAKCNVRDPLWRRPHPCRHARLSCSRICERRIERLDVWNAARKHMAVKLPIYMDYHAT